MKVGSPCGVRIKNLLRSATKNVLIREKIMAIYMAFLEIAQPLWQATIPTTDLTDNKSVTRIFQPKAIPPALWNACDYVLQFSSKIAELRDQSTPQLLLSPE